MSLTQTTHLAPAHGLRPLAGLAAKFQAWNATRAARRQRARELRQLARFTDSDLKDVGLVRADFMAIEAGTFTRE